MGDPLLVQARAKSLLLPGAKRYWIESDADWDKLYPELTQTSLFDTNPHLDIRFNLKKLDTKGQAFFKHCLQEAVPLNLICQAPALQLSPALTALFKKSKTAALIELKPLKGKAFIEQLHQELKAAHFTFETSLPAYLAHFTEGNYLAAHQCITQLILLYEPKTHLTKEHLQPLLTDEARFPIYALTQACIEGKPAPILRMLTQFQQEEIAPILVLWHLSTLTRQLRALHQNTAFETLRIWPSQVNAYSQALKRLSLAHLTTLLHQAQQFDLELKSKATCYIWDKLEDLALRFATYR